HTATHLNIDIVSIEIYGTFYNRQHQLSQTHRPTDEEVPDDDPNESGDPTERDADERTENRAERGDALKLIPPQDVPTHGKVLDAIHVHVRRRRLLRIGSPDVPIDPLPIAPVRNRIQHNRAHAPQKPSFQK